MTAAQRYIEQGIQQGIQQGQCAMLLHLLRQRFGDEVTVEVERRIQVASAAQLERWTGRVLSAATLAELLAD